MMNRIKQIIFLFLILFSRTSFAQTWIVPPEKSRVMSSFPFTDQTRKSGQSLYTVNCKSCHGDPGKANSIKLTPPPPDPAGPKMQQNTDGDMLFKIREGHGVMPSFKNSLANTAIWEIISFFRSFNPQYHQQLSSKSILEGETKLSLSWLKDQKQIEALLTNENNRIIKPLNGEEIQLFAIRYFGNLPVDQIKETDQNGKATFNFPTDLPGDSTGRIRILARVSDETKYGEVKTDTVIMGGVPTWMPALNHDRAMWNTVRKAPVWLLISYIAAVLTIWSFILYVIYQIHKILILGKQNQFNQE